MMYSRKYIKEKDNFIYFMKLISFDIGIKNMGYCIFEISGNVPLIKSWDIINLINIEKKIDKCNCKLKNNEICNKKASYYDDNNYYCRTHVKKSNKNVLEKEIKISKNKKIDELKEIANENKMNINFDQKKDNIIDEMNKEIKNKFLQKVREKKIKTTQDYDLIELGKKMKEEFNKIEEFEGITDVIIENQISPIANRMKTLQGMVAQYFIMINDEIKIEFISSSNKLKHFEVEKKDYKENKKNSVYYCNKVLKSNEKNYEKYINYLDNYKKKDDLADSFLQGIWYLKFKNTLCSELRII